MISNAKSFNYKVLDLTDLYNLEIGCVFIQDSLKISKI